MKPESSELVPATLALVDQPHALLPAANAGDRVAITWLGLAIAEGVFHQALQRDLAQSDDDFH